MRSLNLKGANKAQLLEEKFGKQQFDYVGDSHADFAVWRSARRAVVVSDSKRFVAAINSIVPVEAVFPKTTGRFQRFAQGMPSAPVGQERVGFCSHPDFTSIYRFTRSPPGCTGVFQF